MRYRCLLVLCFPYLLYGQTNKVYTLDLSGEQIDLSGLTFRVDRVIDRTGVTDGRFGTVFTGMLNNQRDLVVQDGLELNLAAALMRSATDRKLPTGTLQVSYLRIDEEITLSSERRRLQLEAALEMTDPSGRLRVYGPLQVSRVEGGLDVTSGHARALAESLSELLQQVDQLVREGEFTDGSELTALPPADLPDGVLYSVADYRAGRVDTSVRLALEWREEIWLTDTGTFYEAGFIRPENYSRRDLRELWGYQHEGTTYLYLQRKYYSLQTDAVGQTLVAIPGGVVDTEARTKQAALGGLLFGAVGGAIASSVGGRGRDDVYTVNLMSGALGPHESPQSVADKTEDYANRILLHHISPAGSPGLLLRFGGSEYVLTPGAYTVLDAGGALTVSLPEEDSKSLTKNIWITEGEPALYTVVVNAKGKIELTRGSTESAVETVRRVAGGAEPVSAR